ncbi:hypothetical protein ABFX02_01G109300 [Erythranthe guttata]
MFESSGNKPPKGKKKITIEYDGGVVGDHSKQWSSRTGDFVRAHIPISYKDFRDVPNNFKDDVWNALMGEVEPDVPSHVARPLAEKTWSQKFRTHKNSMRVFLKNNPPKAEPKGIDPIIWRRFVENEKDPKKEDQNEKNKKQSKKVDVFSLPWPSHLRSKRILDATRKSVNSNFSS